MDILFVYKANKSFHYKFANKVVFVENQKYKLRRTLWTPAFLILNELQ